MNFDFSNIIRKPFTIAGLRAALSIGFLCCFWSTAQLAENAQQTRMSQEPNQALRVVSLAPSVTESLVALGLQEVLVGVTKYCRVASREDVAVVGGLLDFNLERIVALQPSHVFVLAESGNYEPRVRQLIKLLGNKVIVLRVADVKSLKQSLMIMGTTLNRPKEAMALVKDIDGALQELRKSEQESGAKRRVGMVVGCQPVFVAGSNTFLDEWLTIVGANNVFSNVVGFKPYGPEQLQAANPDFIFLTVVEQRCPTIERLKELNPGWRVESLPTALFSQPGPQLIESLHMLVHRLRNTPD